MLNKLLGQGPGIVPAVIAGTGVATTGDYLLYGILVAGDNDMEIKLTDDADGTGTVIVGIKNGTQRHFTFDPPVPFDTGIYVKQMDNCDAIYLIYHVWTSK